MKTLNCKCCGGFVLVRGDGEPMHDDMRECLQILQSQLADAFLQIATLRQENEQAHKRIRRDAAYWVETGV